VTLALRTLPWQAMLLVAAVAVTLVVVRSDPAMLRVAGVILAAGAALCCDDPAAGVTDATPTPRLVRRGLRWVAAAGYACAGWFALLLLVEGVAVRAAAQELAALLTLALACGTVAGAALAAPSLIVLILADDVFGDLLGEHAGQLRAASIVVAVLVLADALRDPAGAQVRLLPFEAR
jgi:hypothetical protein